MRALEDAVGKGCNQRLQVAGRPKRLERGLKGHGLRTP